MMFAVTFAFTVFCILITLAFAHRQVTGRPMHGMWIFFLVLGISFAWLMYLDIATWIGDPSPAIREWREFVHAGSIAVAGFWVLWRNRDWRHGLNR